MIQLGNGMSLLVSRRQVERGHQLINQLCTRNETN